MKKTGFFVRLLALAMVVSLGGMSTGCFGKFALTRKIYSINEGMGNKIVQTLICWVFLVIPVYEVAGLVDFFILNLIEFLTGSNPMAQVERTDGDTRTVLRMERQGGSVVATMTRYRDGQVLDTLRVNDTGAGAVDAVFTPAEGDTKLLSAIPATDGSVITTVKSAAGTDRIVYLPEETDRMAARLDALLTQPQSFSLAEAGAPRG